MSIIWQISYRASLLKGLSALLCSLWMLPVQASLLHPHSAIREQVKTYVEKNLPITAEEQLTVEVSELDRRLKLNQCDVPLTLFTPGTNRHKINLVGVECQGRVSWKIYVPVKAKVLTPVVIARRPVLRDSLITARDVTLATMDRSKLRQGYFASPEQVVGRLAKHYFSIGQALTPRMVAVTETVKRGQLVDIIARNQQLQVAAKGEALGSGQQGEQIKVKNQSSERVVDAVIVGPGKVEVIL